MSSSHAAALPAAADHHSRRHRAFWLALVAALIGVFAFSAAPALANGSACTVNPEQGKLCVAVSDTPDAVSYSAFDGNSTFLSYKAVLSNASRSSQLSHVGLTETLPAQTGFDRVTTTKGSCAGGQTVNCSIGSLKKGESATVTVVVRAPSTTDPNPPDITIANTVIGVFDERFNDQTGGKQDTATYIEPTTVSKSAGQTFIPQGSSGQVSTDPSGAQYGNVKVTSATSDVIASLKPLAADSFCLLGQVTIQGNVYVCRNGGWLDASVRTATGTRYENTTNPLVFHLRWSSALSSVLQTKENFVVFYRTGANAPVSVIDARCPQTEADGSCLDPNSIKQESGGGWSVDLIAPHNGHMR